MAGTQVSRQQVDSTSGAICSQMNEVMERIGRFKFWLDAKPDADLAALGYSPEEVADLRSAFGDLAQLREIYTGVASLGSNKDFRTFVRRLWGLGMV